MSRKWQVGDQFHHRKWWGRLLPAICEVVSVRRDGYKGEPRTVIIVQEVGGTRRASYFDNEVPSRTQEEIRCLKSLI